LPTKVSISAQVRAYQGKLSPEPRRRLKLAIMGVAEDKGDIKAFTDKLEGFYRLRVGQHRVVYRHCDGRIECFYAAPRKTVYEYLSAHMRETFEG
jgi:mRNA interferase RelE/StbE